MNSSSPSSWDWKGNQFLPGAQLGWQQEAGGFTYEAAIPWKSLFVEPPPAGGTTINFEVGMGFGSAFLDWTGRDPDTAANLAPLTLVEQLSPEARATPVPAVQRSGDVALAVRLDGGEAFTIDEATSPDRDYLWLDRVSPEPLKLAAGPHTLEFRFAGINLDRRTVVDAFLLQPTVDRKVLTLPDGSTVTIEHSMISGETMVTE
ncbi:MAG: hypothetical protein M5U01_33275 [Ardenticatenaceae bacterium]|nr:hypothetical protein [Ardenticatenaceae bacterium]